MEVTAKGNWFLFVWILFNVTFSNGSAISWLSVFIGGGSRSPWKKNPTFGKKTGNNWQLRFESSKPCLQYVRLEPATSVWKNHVINSRITTLITQPPRPLKWMEGATRTNNGLNSFYIYFYDTLTLERTWIVMWWTLLNSRAVWSFITFGK